MSCLAKAIVSWTVEFLMGGRLLVLLENKKEMLNPRRQKSHQPVFCSICTFICKSLWSSSHFNIFSGINPPPPPVGPYSVWRQYYYFVVVVFTLQGGLACCGSWGRKQSDTTERLSWTELINSVVIQFFDVVFVPWVEKPSILRVSP